MKIGFIGLGKMGSNMVLHLKEQGIEVAAYNRSPHDLATAQTIADLVKQIPQPRVIWLMIAAEAVDQILDSLIASGLQKGDIVIDGGNSFYKDTQRRSVKLDQTGINYIDCGTSGGLEGARHGACLMIGGDETVVKQLEWLWLALSLPKGWRYVGPSGAGHFAKMVHNGIEYGFNQSLGEGFALLKEAPFHYDLAAIADLWSHGSVVRGWLVELLAHALAEDPRLEKLTGRVGGGETGKWALETAKELGVKAEILEEAVEEREKALAKPTFISKIVSALRRQYGGHEESKVT